MRSPIGGPGALERVAKSPDRPAEDRERLPAVLGNNRRPGVSLILKRAEEFGLDDGKGAVRRLFCGKGG